MSKELVSLPILEEGFEYIAVKKLDEGITRNVVTLKSDEVCVILPAETVQFVDKAFSMQTDYENPSKFLKVFSFDAFKARLAYVANSAVAQWEREINKYLKMHPKHNREQAITELCESREKREMMSRAVAGEQVKDTL